MFLPLSCAVRPSNLKYAYHKRNYFICCVHWPMIDLICYTRNLIERETYFNTLLNSELFMYFDVSWCNLFQVVCLYSNVLILLMSQLLTHGNEFVSPWLDMQSRDSVNHFVLWLSSVIEPTT